MEILWMNIRKSFKPLFVYFFLFNQRHKLSSLSRIIVNSLSHSRKALNLIIQRDNSLLFTSKSLAKEIKFVAWFSTRIISHSDWFDFVILAEQHFVLSIVFQYFCHLKRWLFLYPTKKILFNVHIYKNSRIK